MGSRRPILYTLHTRLSTPGGAVSEESDQRFGFREVWFDGPDLYLNDHPIHLFSDWGHKTTPYYLTETWTRQWFAMLRAGHLNHSRLHTHPRTVGGNLEHLVHVTGEVDLDARADRRAVESGAHAARHEREAVRGRIGGKPGYVFMVAG